MGLRQYGVAQPLIEQALHAMKGSFGESSVQMAECAYQLARVLTDSGKAELAEPYAEQALSIRQECFDLDCYVTIDSVQQVANICDTIGKAEKAFGHYRTLLDYYKSLEDEDVFAETVTIVRSILCLFFRTLGTTERRVVNQLRRKEVSKFDLKKRLETLIDGNALEIAKEALKRYQKEVEPADFEILASIYHVAFDEFTVVCNLQDL
jgi:tetratricopeptide (TPR) repeat protein